MWRSLVACLNGVQEAGSSNLLTQTITGYHLVSGYFSLLCFHNGWGYVMLQFGMPALIETNTITECAALAHELGLHFADWTGF